MEWVDYVEEDDGAEMVQAESVDQEGPADS
jgi:hypothetical protein